VNTELERIWENADVALFEVLFWHLPGGTEANYDKLSGQSAPQLNIVLGRGPNRLPTEPTCSVFMALHLKLINIKFTPQTDFYKLKYFYACTTQTPDSSLGFIFC
jgi:hypothetical protein